MLDGLRFWVYKQILSLLTLVAFRGQKVTPLDTPVDGRVEVVPYSEAFPDLPVPGLFVPTAFPPGDHAGTRERRIAGQDKLLAVLQRVVPRTTPPVPADERAFVKAVYPRWFRKAWPVPPTVAPRLASAPDLLAELATTGPFGSYLRASGSSYELDLSWMDPHPVAPGLLPVGGRAVLDVVDGALVTTSVTSQPALLAALNEDLTTFRHNTSVHLTMLTSFAVASTNCLPGAHPVRRLLHHCFNTVLIGNVEVATAQVAADGFSASIFSHEAPALLEMLTDHVGRFDFWDFEPTTQFARRRTRVTPFPYPYRDNVLALWEPTLDYVTAYVDLYYADDDAVAVDLSIRAWAAELERLLPNGIAFEPTRDWLARFCATLIHVSTVEHDVLNNVVWNYSTLSWLVPTVVPASGELMDQRRAFDLIATIIGTWKPYNMLLSADIAKLALDEPAAEVMRSWITALDRVQDAMTAEGPEDLSLSYPAQLNVSISN